jgi:hypothetical protein
MPPLRFVAIPLLTTLLVACGGGSSSGPPPYDGPTTVPYQGSAPLPGSGTGSDTELDRQRQLWSSHGIADYRYTLRWVLYAPPALTDPVVVEVRGGQVVSRTYEQSGLPTDPRDASMWPSVDGLFDLLEDAYARNPDRIEVRYDSQFGHPTRADIDYDAGLADDEQTFVAGSLTILP